MTEQEQQIWNAAFGCAAVMYPFGAVMAANHAVIEFRKVKAKNPDNGTFVRDPVQPPSAEHSVVND